MKKERKKSLNVRETLPGLDMIQIRILKINMIAMKIRNEIYTTSL